MVLVSIVVIIVGNYVNDAFKLLLRPLAFQVPTILFPLLAGIMGLKVDKHDFYIAFLGTLVAFVATKLYLLANCDHFAIMIHIAINATVFFGRHLVKHKGFVIVGRSQDTSELWQPVELSVIARMKLLIPTPSPTYH